MNRPAGPLVIADVEPFALRRAQNEKTRVQSAAGSICCLHNGLVEAAVARKRPKKSSGIRSTRRAGLVWACFGLAMTTVAAALLVSDRSAHSGFAATSIVLLGEEPARDAIFQTRTPLDHQRWTSIVIHHSGMPAGDAESLDRYHRSKGFHGLGYHFVIGNGTKDLDDGVLQIGYRWNEQLPGAHALGQQAEQFNQHAIAICLIGNGDRRTFSEKQMLQLTRLVQKLQREFGIPAAAVRLHRDIAPGVSSPGRLFPAAKLREQLLDEPRG